MVYLLLPVSKYNDLRKHGQQSAILKIDVQRSLQVLKSMMLELWVLAQEMVQASFQCIIVDVILDRSL